MQSQLLCATCASPLSFIVPELTGNRWHVLCSACGKRTSVEPSQSGPEELAVFRAAGVHTGP